MNEQLSAFVDDVNAMVRRGDGDQRTVRALAEKHFAEILDGDTMHRLGTVVFKHLSGNGPRLHTLRQVVEGVLNVGENRGNTVQRSIGM